MRVVVAQLLCALASLASGAVLGPRQLPKSLGDIPSTPLKVAFVETLEPSIKDRSGVVRELVGFGPIRLVSVALPEIWERVEEY
jgi:hypothetical protein